MGKLLITGANGQLGRELQDLAPAQKDYDVVFNDQAQLDITDHSAVTHFVVEHQPDVILNTAAYTAVDRAETDTETADNVNHRAVAHLAKLAKENHIKLIHISTDYVFDGRAQTPYTETDIPKPQTVYGKGKWAGEKALLEMNPENSVIVRTSWLYSAYGSNFVKTMLRLGKEKKEINVVDDQVGSPTYARDLAKALLEMMPKLQHPGTKVYHYANAGHCSWYTFAQTIFKLVKIPVQLYPVPTRAYPTPAKRPTYSVLNTDKIQRDFGVKVVVWETALEDFLNTLV